MAKRRLTQQQRARIAQIQQNRRDKAAARAEAALADTQQAETKLGQVIVRHGQNLIVSDPQAKTTHCLFRQNLGEVVCGDQVLWQATENNQGVVIAIEPRNTTLSRPDYSGHDKPIAANLTQLIVVLAPEPAPSGYLLDQYLIAAERIGIDASICLNKADLLDAQQLESFTAAFKHYQDLGYPLISISAKREHGLDPLLNQLKDHTSILVGQSGVGKSSLSNAVLPQQQSIEEGRLSDATGLGRHTTSTATLYDLPQGGQIIDSPGVRSFRLGKLSRLELQQGYRELRDLIGECRFSNCQHQQEPNCAINRALSEKNIHPERHASFMHMLSNCED